MAHFAREQFASFFGLFAAGNVEESSAHHTPGVIVVGAVPARSNPPHFLAQLDAKIDFIGPGNGAGGIEGRSNPVTVDRVDAFRQLLKSHFVGWFHAP